MKIGIVIEGSTENQFQNLLKLKLKKEIEEKKNSNFIELLKHQMSSIFDKI